MAVPAEGGDDEANAAGDDRGAADLIRSRRAAHDVRPTTVRLAARSAVAVLSIFTLVDVIGTFMVIGHYEYRITVVTHGQPDVWVAAMAYLTPGRADG